jgi:two-component system NarL family sensor kinase
VSTTTSPRVSVRPRWRIPRPLRRRGDDPTLARLFARFALTGLLAVIVVGAAGVVLLRREATSRAIREAKDLTHLAAQGIVGPLITPGVLNGNRVDLARLDRAVHRRILNGTPIVRVKIWDAQGRIVYSDAPGLVGSVYPLEDDELHALRTGGTVADASDLARPENRSERHFNRLLEVYFGIRGPRGTRLLYEDYERSSTVSASSRRQWTSLLPALLGGLLVLYLVQVPLAYSLARRLRAKQREREELLRRAIDASDLERRRVAADLHDGAVQRLAGISLGLAASARRPRTGGPEAQAVSDEFAAAAAETRDTIRELRTLLVDIYPPTLQRSGLPAALDDLVAPLTAAKIAVNLRLPESFSVPDDVSALLYRVAQEAIRNVRTHAQATTVDVCIEQHDREAVLSITDDGQGFATAGGAASAEEPTGHFGLRLMRDLISHAGGTLELDSSPERGTRVRATVPLP